LRTDPGAIIGSAAALMYQIDGNPRCRDAAVVVGDGLVEKQTAAGFWFKQDEADATDPAYQSAYTGRHRGVRDLVGRNGSMYSVTMHRAGCKQILEQDIHCLNFSLPGG
jgi:hypothetical protein